MYRQTKLILFLKKSNPVFAGTLVPYLFAAEHVSGSLFGMFSNGASVGITMNTAQTFTQNNIYLGTNATTSSFFSGNISEVLYYKTSLTSSGRTIVYCYLSQKYNLSLTGSGILCD